MHSARSQKQTTLKDIRDIDTILVKVYEKENIVVFKKVAQKCDLYIIGVSNASYNQDTKLVAGDILLLGSKNKKNSVTNVLKEWSHKEIC